MRLMEEESEVETVDIYHDGFLLSEVSAFVAIEL